MTTPPKPSKKVYLRRRIAVLLGFLAFIAVVVMIIAGPSRVIGWFGANTDPSDETTSEQPSQNTDNEDAAVGECEPEDLRVNPVTNQEAYGEEERPQLSLQVTNTGETACDADLGTATMGFEIKSGDETYWNSRDCQIKEESTLVRMEPDQTLDTEPVEWNRTRSTPETCEDDERPAVPAGGVSYHLSVEIAGVESESTKQFILH